MLEVFLYEGRTRKTTTTPHALAARARQTADHEDCQNSGDLRSALLLTSSGQTLRSFAAKSGDAHGMLVFVVATSVGVLPASCAISTSSSGCASEPSSSTFAIGDNFSR